MATWRVMLNGRFWKQDRYEGDFASRLDARLFAQSKGRCRMISCPGKGDTVVFVLKGRIVMKGRVESDGFVDGTAHQAHSCNEGVARPHATVTEFAWIRIEEVGLSENIRRTGQRTWVKISNGD
jgi:hypothetical protein